MKRFLIMPVMLILITNCEVDTNITLPELAQMQSTENWVGLPEHSDNSLQKTSSIGKITHFSRFGFTS